jgi:hypothetical protein
VTEAFVAQTAQTAQTVCFSLFSVWWFVQKGFGDDFECASDAKQSSKGT